MDNFIILTRILTAIGAPIAAIVLSALAILRAQRDQGHPPPSSIYCLRCNKAQSGDLGQFHYSEAATSPKQRAFQRQLNPKEKDILGSESHFVCDTCARGYLLRQVLQVVLMVVPYPLYLYVVMPLLGDSAFFANFLIETVLVIFVLAGATAAYDLFRASREGETPLAEMRDRIAIKIQKTALGKQRKYVTRLGKGHPRDKPR